MLWARVPCFTEAKGIYLLLPCILGGFLGKQSAHSHGHQQVTNSRAMEPELIWMRYKKDSDEWQFTLYTGEMMGSNGDGGNRELRAPNKGGDHFFSPIDCSLRQVRQGAARFLRFSKRWAGQDRKWTNFMHWFLSTFAPLFPPKAKWNNQLAVCGPPVTDLCCVIKGRHSHHPGIRGPAWSLQRLPQAFSEF